VSGAHDRGRGEEKTAHPFDLRVQELVATGRGALTDLAWKAPSFDPATRQLVGFELFRDDTSTQPPSRLTSALVPGQTLEARDLEVRPHSQYGVQPIWRTAGAGPIAAIEFGPPRLTKDLAGPGIFVPPEERIHALAYLQRQGAITSLEMEQAVERFLGRAQPALAEPPIRPAAALGAGAAGASPSTRRRVALTYIVIVVVMVIALVGAQQLISRFLLNPPSAVNLPSSTPSAQPSPSPSPSASPTPTTVAVDLHPVLIKTTDLRTGYVAGPFSSQPLCSACTPAVSSLSVVFGDTKLNRTILTAASIAPGSSDSPSVAAALMASVTAPQNWASVKGLGDAASSTSVTTQNGTQISYYVVWRTGAMTNEVMLVGPRGALTLQNAIALAKIQQARAAKALG
jgi:hypothetical protein